MKLHLLNQWFDQWSKVMNNPSKLSYSEKHELLAIIKKVKPQKWGDIATGYGWLPGLGGGLNGDALHRYIMFSLQILKTENFIAVNITHGSTRFSNLQILRKGMLCIYSYHIIRFIYWIFAVGIVSASAIKTLFME